MLVEGTATHALPVGDGLVGVALGGSLLGVILHLAVHADVHLANSPSPPQVVGQAQRVQHHLVLVVQRLATTTHAHLFHEDGERLWRSMIERRAPLDCYCTWHTQGSLMARGTTHLHTHRNRGFPVQERLEEDNRLPELELKPGQR